MLSHCACRKCVDCTFELLCCTFGSIEGSSGLEFSPWKSTYAGMENQLKQADMSITGMNVKLYVAICVYVLEG